MSARPESTVMHWMRHGRLIAGFLVWNALGSQPSEAQFTANFQTNIISGVASSWSGDYLVGNDSQFDLLTIENGGELSNGTGFIGYTTNAEYNAALVTGNNSFWSNSVDLYIGVSGSDNSLTISNGGVVINNFGYIGYNTMSSNNNVLVSDIGSFWSNTAFNAFTMSIGY